MKRKAWIVMALVMVVALAGCASLVNNSYKTLYLAGQSYDTGMKAVAEFQKSGKITETQRAEINKYANLYYVAYNAAVDALKEYQRDNTVANKEKLASALSATVAAYKQFIGNANRIAPALGLNTEVLK